MNELLTDTTVIAAIFTLIGAIIAAVVALVSSIVTTYFTSMTQNKQRIIGAITTQRIEWINSVRGVFTEFLSIIHILVAKEPIFKSKAELLRSSDWEQYIILKSKLFLYLNPREDVYKNIEKLEYSIRTYFTNDREQQSMKNLYTDLKFLEQEFQIVLKSEWKVVKQETRKGRELTYMEKEKIFEEAKQTIGDKQKNIPTKNNKETLKKYFTVVVVIYFIIAFLYAISAHKFLPIEVEYVQNFVTGTGFIFTILGTYLALVTTK